MPFYTPLRYPGGKRRLASFVMGLLEANDLHDVSYYEPYAGGAAVALALLIEEYAAVIHLNDLSRAVYAFWDSVLYNTEELCSKVKAVSLNMKEWERQRSIYDSRETADLGQLGFATLFLNRTNRSGILSGGVIGGKAQAGLWHLDARFNKPELVQRIHRISRYRNRIRLYQLDALRFTTEVVCQAPPQSFTFYDPPYIENGKGLYLNDYTVEGHRALSEQVSKIRTPWIVTYDAAATKHDLYSGNRRINYGLSYSAQHRYQGKEVMFMANNLDLPNNWSTEEKVAMSAEKSGHPLYGVLDHKR